MDKESASIHVQARLTPSEYQPFETIISTTGIKKATLFRRLILANKDNVQLSNQSAEEAESKRRLIFLANKASNNINQIARRLNVAYRSEIVSERNYVRIMNELVGLRSAFEKGLDKC